MTPEFVETLCLQLVGDALGSPTNVQIKRKSPMMYDHFRKSFALI